MYFTISEFAKITGYSVRSIRGFMQSGKIKGTKTQYKWLIPETELEKLKERKKDDQREISTDSAEADNTKR